MVVLDLSQNILQSFQWGPTKETDVAAVPSLSGDPNLTFGRNDALIALVFAILGATAAVSVLTIAGYVFFYQPFTPELVYWACGKGFLDPTMTPQPVLDFLFGRTLNFDCTILQTNQSLGPAGLFARSQFYLSWSVAILWRLSSVDYRNLWPLVGALAGAYAAGCFMLLRLFFQRTMATVGSVVLSLSPVALSMIVSLRDYSKAPFFIWGMVFLFVAGRASSRRVTLAAAVSAGAVVGLGYGFRSDLMLLVPVGLLFLTLGLQHGTWRRRVWAPMSFIVVALIVAAPVLAPKNAYGGGGGTLIMQGATEPFRIFLGLGTAPYNLGWRYSDELTLSSIAADERARDPGWDANEGPAVYSVSQAIRRSSRYVFGWLPWFAGDMATQMLKSSAWTVGFPALVAEGRQRFDPGGITRSALAPTRVISWLYDSLGRAWLPPLGILGLLIFILRTTVRPREAICVSLMLAILLSYPAIQFSVRHLFHLEFIWVVSVLALLMLPFEWPVLVAMIPRFALWVGIVAATICATYAGLLAFQDYSLRREFQAMVGLPREVVPLLPNKSRDDSQVAFLVPLPSNHRSLVEGQPDSMTNRFPEVANQWDTRAAVERLVLTLGGSSCPSGETVISLEYTKRNDVWQPLDYKLPVDLSRSEKDTSQTIVIVPAFYRPTQYLASISVSASHATCIVGIERITGRTRLPATLSAVLGPGWQSRPLHRAYGRFSVTSASFDQGLAAN